MSAKTTLINIFKGLNNVADPLSLGLQWLTEAENVDVTEDGAVVRREGYAMALPGELHGAWSCDETGRMYMVNGDQLVRVMDDLSQRVLMTGLLPLPMYFTEVNGDVYFSNGPDKGIIRGDEVREWAWTAPMTPSLSYVSGDLPAGTYQVLCTFMLADGRETGACVSEAITLPEGSALQINDLDQREGATTMIYIAPANSDVFQYAFSTTASSATWNAGAESLGAEIDGLYDPAPQGGIVPVFHGGRMHLMEYLPSNDTTVVWVSEPLAFHLFRMDSSFVQVRGKGVLMCSTAQGLIIGTKTDIYLWDGTALTTLADFGCVSPHGWATDDERRFNGETEAATYLWTTRGVCRTFPFANLTGGKISVSSGQAAGAAIVKSNGHKRFVVALQKGGAAFNKRGT